MMCQLEQYLYAYGHDSDSSFDFEPTDRQSCGFVGVQKPYLQRIYARPNGTNDYEITWWGNKDCSKNQVIKSIEG